MSKTIVNPQAVGGGTYLIDTTSDLIDNFNTEKDFIDFLNALFNYSVNYDITTKPSLINSESNTEIEYNFSSNFDGNNKEIYINYISKTEKQYRHLYDEIIFNDDEIIEISHEILKDEIIAIYMRINYDWDDEYLLSLINKPIYDFNNICVIVELTYNNKKYYIPSQVYESIKGYVGISGIFIVNSELKRFYIDYDGQQLAKAILDIN